MICMVIITAIATLTQSIDIHFDSRIVNGNPISTSQYPFMVSLRQEIYGIPDLAVFNVSFSFCGGSLIQLLPPVILTAAHCLENFKYINASTNTITLYNHSMNLKNWEGELYVDINRTYPNHNVPGDVFTTIQIMDLSQVYIHAQYNELGFADNDIALIIFKDYTDTIFNTTIVLPIIPTRSAHLMFDRNDRFKAIGYGRNETEGKGTFSLHETSKPFRFIANIDCWWAALEWLNISKFYDKTDFNPELFASYVCAIGNDTDICIGDTGGPLLTENQVEIVGISSFVIGLKCNSGDPAVFTNIGHFYHWIMKTIDFAVHNITWCPTAEPSAPTTKAPSSTAPTTKAPSSNVEICDEATEEINSRKSERDLWMFIANSRKSERDSWMIIAIVFICLFGITFIILVYKVCSEKRYTSTVQKNPEGRTGLAQCTVQKNTEGRTGLTHVDAV